MRLQFIIAFFLLTASTAVAQQTITLTENKVLTETWVIDESTVIEGNGYSIICPGCDPMILVTNKADVSFKNTYFRKGYTSWIRRNSGSVSWDSPRMKGFIRQTSTGG